MRVVVVGCAGSGKSTLSAVLAARLGVPHVERDLLGELGSDEFRAAVAEAVAGEGWVFDGAPYYVENVVYPRAELVVALDYPRRTVMRRVVARSLRLKLGLAGGSHSPAPFRRWLDPDWHVRWAWSSWPERRREIAELAGRRDLVGAEIVRLDSPRAAAAWLSGFGPYATGSRQT